MSDDFKAGDEALVRVTVKHVGGRFHEVTHGSGLHQILFSVEPSSLVHRDAETLRDRFAMAALTGLLSNAFHTGKPNSGFSATCADAAYEFADAMMKAREPLQATIPSLDVFTGRDLDQFANRLTPAFLRKSFAHPDRPMTYESDADFRARIKADMEHLARERRS